MPSDSSVKKLYTVGKLDIDIVLTLTDEIISDYKIDTASLNSLSSQETKRLLSMKEIQNLLYLDSKSAFMASVININKINRRKIYLEFCHLSNHEFTEEEKYLKPIIQDTIQRSFIVLKEVRDSTCSDAYRVRFIVKHYGSIISEMKISSKNGSSSKDDSVSLFHYDLKSFSHIYLDLDENQSILNQLIQLLQNISSIKAIRVIVYFPSILKNRIKITSEYLDSISKIMSFTDMFIFDIKEGYALLGFLNYLSKETSTQDEQIEKPFPNGKIPVNDLKNKFINSFKSIRRNFPITALFVDQMKSISIVQEINLRDCVTETKELNVVLKRNHSNLAKWDKSYKSLIVHYEYIFSVFRGAFLGRLCSGSNILDSIESAGTLSRKILSMISMNLDIPLDGAFYHVSSKSQCGREVQTYRPSFRLEKSDSALKEYNPLLDQHLGNFFSRSVNRKHLLKLGFVSSKGFLMRKDPDHKAAKYRYKDSYDDDEKRSIVKAAIGSVKLSNSKNLNYRSCDPKAANLRSLICDIDGEISGVKLPIIKSRLASTRKIHIGKI